jgi:hypothetical protein
MLKYLSVYAINDARERLHYNRYNKPWANSHHTRDGDMLMVFSETSRAVADSRENFDNLMSVAQKTGSELLIITRHKIQFLGQTQSNIIQQQVLPQTWVEEFQEWTDTTRPMDLDVQLSESECATLRPWRNCFTLKENQGIFEVRTGERLTNRRNIIERFWDQGFASWRGRPLTVASICWSGSRDELQEITYLADRYWNRRHTSDVAKKICSAYTAINRHAAWPGAW